MRKTSLSLKFSVGNQLRGLLLIKVRLLSQSLPLFPFRTMEKILKLCPRLRKIRVLMEDLNFRYFEMFPHLEEVNRTLACSPLT